jgi:hypothetical protein
LFSRYGVRYSSFTYTDEGADLAEVGLVTPFINVGTSSVINSVVFSYGFGMGYNVGGVEQKSDKVLIEESDYSGFALTSEFSFGIKF